MSNWYRLNLGDAMLATIEIDRIKTAFQTMTADNADHRSTALYIRHDSEGRLHCEATLFFPPEMSLLAEQFKAQPCNTPSSDGLGLLIGSSNAWMSHFPHDSR